MKTILYTTLALLLFTTTSFAGDPSMEQKLTEASAVLQKIVTAEQLHLQKMGSYISASSALEIRYNLEIEIPLDSYFNYTVIFSNGCYRAMAELKKSVGDAHRGDKIIVTCDGTKEVLPPKSALKKYAKDFLKE